MSRSRHRIPRNEDLLNELTPPVPDLAYWLEHIMHWHALLFAVIAALTVGYMLSSQQPILAEGDRQTVVVDVQDR